MKRLNILIYFVLVIVAQGKLTLVHPPELAKEFSFNNISGAIAYDVANFGHYPYGKVLENVIQLASTNDGCQSLNHNYSINQPFVIVYKENCSFVNKTRNIQRSGGTMAIIISDDDIVHNKLILSNDGMGFEVSIPTIFIGKEDGEKIMNYLNSLSTLNQNNRVSKSPVIRVIFETNQAKKSFIRLALDFNNRFSVLMVNQLSDAYKSLKQENKIEIVINYFVYECTSCKAVHFQQKQMNCLGGGRYCVADPDGIAKPGTGQDALYEIIRSLCLSMNSVDKWFSYLNLFDKNCLNPIQYKECSNQILQTILDPNLKNQVEACFRDSFYDKIVNDLNENFLLDQQIFFNQVSGLIAYPGMMVNNQPYFGNLEQEYMIEEICASLIEMGEYCKQFMQTDEIVYQKIQKSRNWDYFILLVILFSILIVFGIIMMIIQKKLQSEFHFYFFRIKRQIQNQTKAQVNHIIENYIEFQSQKTKSSL